MVYQWIKNNLSSWLPQSCVLCGQNAQHHALCPACIQDLPRLSAHTCGQCGLPLDVTAIPGRCGHCQHEPPPYDRVISRFAYAKPVSQLVARLKFHDQLPLARLFGELLALAILSADSPVQAVLPVPLHSKRLRHRGFNQALEIARPLARTLGLPIVNDVIVRCRDTLPQAEQAAVQRERNIRSAFKLTKSLGYKRIAIVDDVMTSGHTVGEIAKLLRRGGAEQVEVWCVARAWPHHR
jgi:ComF family protein